MFDVKAFGAVGDGTTDDRAAVQAAVNAANVAGGGVVHFPQGRYVLAKNATAHPLIDLNGVHNIHFRGDGKGVSVLLRAVGTYNNDTHIVQIRNGTNISFADLTFDGNRHNCIDLPSTDEQRHGLYIAGLNGPADSIVVEDCEFTRCRGDGVFVIGDVVTNPMYTVTGLKVNRCEFRDNDRSGIACQRGLSGFWITENTFEQITDQSIDTESSGGGALSWGWITNNRIYHNNHTDALTMVVSGSSNVDRCHHITISGNIIVGGSAKIALADVMVLAHNMIDGSANVRALEIQDATHVYLDHCYIEGNTGSVPQEAALFIRGAAGLCDHVYLRGCTVKQNFAANGLDIVRTWNTGENVSVDPRDNVLIGAGTKAFRTWRST